MNTQYGIMHDGKIFYTSGNIHKYDQAGFQTRLIKVIIWESSKNPGLFTLFKFVDGGSQHIASATAGKKLTKLQYAKLHA